MAMIVPGICKSIRHKKSHRAQQNIKHMERKEKRVTAVRVYVTAGDGNVAIVPLHYHDGLDVVGNEVPGLEALAHATSAHGDGIADANSVEAEGNHAGGGNAVTHGLGEVEEVHVAGVALVLDPGDIDLRLGHVVLGDTNAIEHGLGGALLLGLHDVVLVQLHRLGRGFHDDGGVNGE